MLLRLVMFLILCGNVLAQSQNPWPCRDDIRKAEPSALFVRVSEGVLQAFAEQKILPDIADLKKKNIDSILVVHILVGPEGDVRCSQIEEGDDALRQRSLDAAQQWHFKPYLLNGKPVYVDSRIRFGYTRDKVEVVAPKR
jgi:Gram-negative bacterial TonB protein C-terminal